MNKLSAAEIRDAVAKFTTMSLFSSTRRIGLLSMVEVSHPNLGERSAEETR